MLEFTQPLHHKQSQYFHGVQLVWIKGFLSYRQVTLPKLKKQVYPRIYTLKGE